MSRISVIIPAYNSEPYLRRAVQSLLATGQPDLELVIVEDGSTDNTIGVARQLVNENPGKVYLHYHPNHANCGVSATRNLGIERSTGDYIAFLDADDFVFPHRFEKATSILESQPKVDGVHELAEVVFESAAAASQWGSHSASLFGFAESIPPERLLPSLLRGYCWHTSAILFRRTLLSRTGHFDCAFRIAEDCHLYYRMAFNGTLVSGELSRPVSVYWRHLASAYQPDPNNRLHNIRAMTAFHAWAGSQGASAKRLESIEWEIKQYILRGLTSARESKEHKLAWKIACHAVWKLPGLTCNRMFRGHIARMALGM